MLFVSRKPCPLSNTTSASGPFAQSFPSSTGAPPPLDQTTLISACTSLPHDLLGNHPRPDLSGPPRNSSKPFRRSINTACVSESRGALRGLAYNRGDLLLNAACSWCVFFERNGGEVVDLCLYLSNGPATQVKFRLHSRTGWSMRKP